MTNMGPLPIQASTSRPGRSARPVAGLRRGLPRRGVEQTWASWPSCARQQSSGLVIPPAERRAALKGAGSADSRRLGGGGKIQMP